MEECGRTLNVGTMQGEEVTMVHECNTQGQGTVHKKKKSTDRVQWVETSVWLICDRRTAERTKGMVYKTETSYDVCFGDSGTKQKDRRWS